MKIITVALILTFFAMGISNVEANPFKGSTQKVEVAESVGSMDQFYSYIANTQQTLKSRLSRLIRKLKQGESGGVFFMILGLTFLYGMIHAAGPGHGKSIIFSYLVGKKDPKLKRTLAICWFVPFAQGLSAMTVIYGIYYLSLGRLVSTFQKASCHANLISFILILGIGIVLLGLKVKSVYQHRKFSNGEGGVDRYGKSSLPLIITLGITPCPGVMILLTFLLAMRLNELAVILVAAMATGMAITISLIGVMTAYSKKRILKTIAIEGKRLHRIEDILEFTGAGLLITLGTILLIGHLKLHPFF